MLFLGRMGFISHMIAWSLCIWCVTAVLTLQSVEPLRRAADGDPLAFAMMLADASMPSGIVVRESVLGRFAGGTRVDGNGGRSVSAVELARAFNARHSE